MMMNMMEVINIWIMNELKIINYLNYFSLFDFMGYVIECVWVKWLGIKIVETVVIYLNAK